MNHNAAAKIRREAVVAAFSGQDVGTEEVADLLYPDSRERDIGRDRQRASQTLVALERRGFAARPDPLASVWRIA